MNPRHNSNQNPPAASAVQQVNSAINQQMCNGNGGGLFPNNNRPIVAPSGFMNFPNQPFLLQNTTMGQFPNGIGGFNPQQNFNPFPVNQFNPSQQQQGQFFAHNSMNPNAYNQNVGLPNEQVILQNTIQNICQLLQLQNPDYAQRPPVNFPMFQNQIPNVMSHQNPGFLANQQFGLSNSNGSMQHANQGQPRFVSPMDANASKQLPNMGQQLQGNPFLPHASGSVQTQQAEATIPNFQHQIGQGMGPQNHSYPHNQLFGMANPNGPGQHINQGQQRFVAPMMDINASRQIANMGQQGSLTLPHTSASAQKQNPGHTLTNSEDNHGNMPANNSNAGWNEPQRKNFKKNDASHKGFKSQFQHAKHMKEKFGTHNGNMNKDRNIAAVNSGPRNSTNQIHSEKKFCVKYTEQEIKQWREARKQHYPSSANVEKKCKKEQALSDLTNQEAMLRRQQLKEILTKQAELGCEVADVPRHYLSGYEKQVPRGKKHEREKYKRGKKFHNKRGTPLEDDDDRITKKTRPGYQDSPNKPKQREPSLLQKLLTPDIKRYKTHLLQVFRFIAINSFFTGEPRHETLRFPTVIVRETNAGVALNVSEKAVDVNCDDGKCNSEALLDKPEKPEEEGEISD